MMENSPRPNSLREQHIYQLAANVPISNKTPVSTVFNDCIETLLQWLEVQIGAPIRRDYAVNDAFEIDQVRRRVHCCALPEKGVWSARLIYPDWKLAENIPAARFDWKVDMTLYRIADSIMFGIRVTCVFLPGDLESVVLQLPDPVAVMAKRHGLRASRPIEDKPWYLDQKNDLKLLKECLVSPKRMLPLVVMTKLDGKQDGISQYPLDERQLAILTFGYAHVVCLPQNMEQQWAATVGNAWATPINAARIYLPGVNLETGSPRSHPWFEASNSILGMNRDELHKILIEVKQYGANKRVHWDNWLFYSEATFRKAAIQRRRKEVEMTKIVADRVKGKESEWSELEDCYHDELSAAQKVIEEKDAMIEERDENLLIDKLRLEEAADRDKIAQHTIRSLQEALVAKTGIREDRSIPVPNGFDEMPSWVEEYLGGRLILHGKAKNGIKDAQYEDPRLVYQALLLLAGPYRNMKLGIEGAKAEWESKLAGLYLDYSPSISPEHMGRLWDDYNIPYPDITKHRFLEYHLKKGTSMDKRFCLRIYFFWDEERRLVVVGSLPGHLPTEQS